MARARSRRMPGTEPPTSPYPTRPPRRRRSRWPWLIPLACLAGLVVLAPAIVASTPLKDRLLAQALPPAAGRLAAQSLELGWFSPVVLRGVEVLDVQSRPLATAEAIAVELTVWEILTGQRSPTAVRVENPKLLLVARPDGSNLEDLLAALPGAAPSAASAPLTAPPQGNPAAQAAREPQPTPTPLPRIEVVAGAAQVLDAQSGAVWEVAGIDAKIDLNSQPPAIELSAQPLPGGSLRVTAGPTEKGSVQVLLDCQNAPLGALAPWLRRFDPSLRIDGLLSGSGRVLARDFTGGAIEIVLRDGFSTRGTMKVERLQVSGATFGDQPMRLVSIEAPWNARAEGGRLRLEQLWLRTPAGSVECSASLAPRHLRDPSTASDAMLRADLDIARLAEVAPGLLPMREGTRLVAGRLKLDLKTSPLQGGRNLTGSLETASLEAVAGGRPVRWEQPVLASFAAAQSKTGYVIDQIDCDADFLKIAARGGAQGVEGTARFDLDRLAERLAQFFDLGATRMAGHGEARFAGAVSRTGVRFSDLTVDVAGFDLATGAWRVAEPRLELRGDLAWDSASGLVESQNSQLITSAVAYRARGLRFDPSGRVPGQGEIALRADLSRAAEWRSDGAAPLQPRGELVGSVTLSGAPGEVRAQIDLTATPLELIDPARPQTPVWSEPEVRVRGGVGYVASAGRLELVDLRVASATLSGAVRGAVSPAQVQIEGVVDYDLGNLTPLLAARIGPGIEMLGRKQAKLLVAGAPAALEGRFEAPWDSASLYGLPVGPGALSGVIGGGAARCDPLDLALGEGRLTTQPLLRFAPPPTELLLPAGDLFRGVRITPEVSEKMLKFIAPALAGATRTDGSFSLRTDGLQLPLDAPQRMSVTGQLAIHGVTVLPGPMVGDWVSTARQIEALAKNRDPLAAVNKPAPTLLEIRDRVIDFRVAEGRVYHRGLRFEVGDVIVETEGSAGFDETIALTVTIPIQDRWIEGEQLLVGLRGRSIQLPVTGTFDQPRVDRRSLETLTRNLVRDAAGQAIQNEVGRALENLFKPR